MAHPLDNLAAAITVAVLVARFGCGTQHDAHVKAWHAMKDREHAERMRFAPRVNRNRRTNRA